MISQTSFQANHNSCKGDSFNSTIIYIEEEVISCNYYKTIVLILKLRQSNSKKWSEVKRNNQIVHTINSQTTYSVAVLSLVPPSVQSDEWHTSQTFLAEHPGDNSCTQMQSTPKDEWELTIHWLGSHRLTGDWILYFLQSLLPQVPFMWNNSRYVDWPTWIGWFVMIYPFL